MLGLKVEGTESLLGLLDSAKVELGEAWMRVGWEWLHSRIFDKQCGLRERERERERDRDTGA